MIRILAITCCITMYQLSGVCSALPDSSGYVIINEISISGNKTTKDHIIEREIVFRIGDSLKMVDFLAAVANARQNILNTQLFNFVSMHHVYADGNRVNVHINVEERWYFWPAPIFEVVDRNFNEWWISGRNFDRTNYGFNLTQENFRGRDEKLQLSLRLGYSQAVGFSYSIPYINRNQKAGIRFAFSYGRRKEVGYGISDSKLLFFRDDNDYVTKGSSSTFTYTYREGIYSTNTFWAQYRISDIADTVLYYNSDYFLPSTTKQELITIGYRYRKDKRDVRAYPLRGSFFELNVIKQGIGVLRNEPDLLHLISTVRGYFSLTDRFFYHTSIKGKLSGRSFAPYFNSSGLGFNNDLVRGYEFYVVNGQHYALFKSNLKYNLLKQRVIKFDLIPLQKFEKIPYAIYVNLNYDMGYVDDEFFANKNPLANTLLIGGGIGLDYVTYYDLVMRIEYSFNKFGENGIFLHFRAPI